ncbi:MAG: DUF1566 domain-containing protein [Deltaproteobacteria bacterium]|nr:DUF1566 domain-containing protein [Deltaproteobacteria bacterium]
MDRVQRRAMAAGIGAAILIGGYAQAKTPAGRFVVGPAGTTVLDTTTGLTWMRQEACCALTPQAEKTLCTKSKLDGGGWRAPTMRELTAILDRSFSAPIYDTSVFYKLAPTSFPYLATSTMRFVPGQGLMQRGVQVMSGKYVDILAIDATSIRCVRN